MYFNKQKSEYSRVLKREIIGQLDINYPLFYSIMYEQAPTYDEARQTKKANFLLELIKKETGIVGTVDKSKNLYFVKGESSVYPTIVAHYDTAQEFHPGLTIQRAGDWIYGFDIIEGEQCGIGADDSVGVYFAIEMLKLLPACKVVLFYGEERGCIGSHKADLDFFQDSTLVSQLDRRSSCNDFIVFTNAVTVFPDKHLPVIQDLLNKYNYEPANGSCTDVGALRSSGLQVASHNTACGYFNEHTDQEIIHIPSMINAMSMVYEIQLRLLEEQVQLSFPYTKKKVNTLSINQSSYNNMENGRNYQLFDDLRYEQGISDPLDQRTKIENEWSYYKYEIDEQFVRMYYGLSVNDLTEENLQKGLVEPVAFVAYHRKGYNASQEKVIDINSDEVREALLSGDLDPRMNDCCVHDYEYHLDENAVSCTNCGNVYPLEYTANDLFDLPDDYRGKLDETIDLLS
jgi:tripeptide aminopeptidase